jgi:hypothetical protein
MENGALTEEAEEDLANNNDPNNNAAEEFDQILDSDYRPEFGINSVSPRSEVNPEETDPDFDDDVNTIRKLLPHKSQEEIRNHLEAFLFHPKRLKVNRKT